MEGLWACVQMTRRKQYAPEDLPREMALGKYDGFDMGVIDVTESWTEVTLTENRLV